MRRNDPLSLGIEIAEREVRLVQIALKGGKPRVVHATALPIPPGAVTGGVVLEPGTVVGVLRRALTALDVPPAGATLAVPGEQTAFRTVTVPPCPDSELSDLVASEIEHQSAFGSGDAYGFFPIHPAEGGEGMRTLGVIGADGAVTRTLVEVAGGAGLSVEALEPTPLAALRAALAGLAPGDSAFVLVVGAVTTEAAYFVQGRLAALRRLDVGLVGLVHTNDFVNWEATDEEPAPTPVRRFDDEGVDRLALEAQRTIDYVQRAQGGAPLIDRALLVGDDPALDSLGAMLERRLGLPVEIPLPPAEAADARFAAVYGLALRAAPLGVASPAMDLFTAERTAARSVETKRYFLGSALVAALAASVGAAACLLYNGQIAASKARCANVQAETAKARLSAEAIIEARAREAKRATVLTKEGVPLGAIMDDVAASLDAGVGLRLVSVADDLGVRLQGEARDETALVRTAQALKASPVLQNVAVDRFDRDDKALRGVIKFELSGQTVSSDRLSEETRG